VRKSVVSLVFGSKISLFYDTHKEFPVFFCTNNHFLVHFPVFFLDLAYLNGGLDLNQAYHRAIPQKVLRLARDDETNNAHYHQNRRQP